MSKEYGFIDVHIRLGTFFMNVIVDLEKKSRCVEADVARINKAEQSMKKVLKEACRSLFAARKLAHRDEMNRQRRLMVRMLSDH